MTIAARSSSIAGNQTHGDGSFLFDPFARICCQTKKNRPRVFDKIKETKKTEKEKLK